MKKALFFGLILILAYAFSANIVVSSISYEPTPAKPAELVRLWIQLKNDSKYDANNVIVALDLKGDRESSFPFFLPDKNNIRYVGSMKAYSTSVVKFDILVSRNAPNGTYKINVLVGEGKLTKQTQGEIVVKNVMPELIILSEKETIAKPGSDIEIKFKVRNIGKDYAYDTVAMLACEQKNAAVFPSGSNEIYIGNIAPNQIKEVSMKASIAPNAKSGVYSLLLKVRFKDREDKVYSNASVIGIKVYEEPMVDASLKIDEESINKGGCGLKMEVYNTSRESAKYVVLQVDSNNLRLKSKKYFIGTLEPDDYDSIDLECEPKTGKINIEAKITFLDSFGNKKVLEKRFNIETKALEEVIKKREKEAEQMKTMLWYLLLIVALIIGYKLAKTIIEHVRK